MSDFDNPSIPLTQAFGHYQDRITPIKCLALPAMFQGARLIAGKLGKVPCNIVKRSPLLNSIDVNHPANWCLARPNALFGKRTLFVVGTVRALLEGNFFAEIIFNDKAEPISIEPLENDQVSIMFVNGELAYRIDQGATRRYLDSSQVLHIKNLTRNPYIGLSVVDVLADSLSNSLAIQKYSNKYFRRLSNVGWIMETPQVLDDEQKKATKQYLEKFTLDGEESFGMGFAGGGSKLIQVNLDNEKAQLIAAKEFDLITIANVLGIPAHKIGSSVNAGYRSLEELEQAFYDDSLSYWCDTWAEELELKLLTTYQLRTGSHFVDWDTSILVKADIKLQHEIDIANLNNGIYTLNELNVMRNRPRCDDPAADKNRMPVQLGFMQDIGLVAVVEPVAEEQKEDAQLQPNPDPIPDTADRYEALLGVTLNRLNTRLKKAYEHAYQNRNDVDIEGHVAVFLETLSPLGVDESTIRTYITRAITNTEVLNDSRELRATIQ